MRCMTAGTPVRMRGRDGEFMRLSPREDQLSDLNGKLQAYLRQAALRRPNSERAGPFLATFNAEDDNAYLNYAIPDDGAEPHEGEIAALIALFLARKRTPRLEYMPAAAPKLEAALLAKGFTVEARVPVMLCLPGMEIFDRVPDGFDVFVAQSERDLEAAARAQAEAFGGPYRGPRGMKRTIRYGGIVVAARDIASGNIEGAGTAMPAIGGVSEITGIGVRANSRRHGVAGAITALLTRQAFVRGVTLAWLTPGSRDAERIYARAGLVVASEALHISRQ
jgi:GNAT superfamily N-acetyltransferase